MEDMKKFKGQIIITSFIVMLPALAGIFLWNRMPDVVATHFDMNGKANGYSSKLFAVFGLPFILLCSHLFCAFITRLDPKKKNISDKVYRLLLWICPLCSIFVSAAIYGFTLGVTFNIASIITTLVGVIFILIGNYLPKCKQNYTVGIKTPWALNDEENWYHTHRLSGFLWVICGILMIANIIIQSNILMIALISIMVIVPYIYSFLYYKKHQ